MIFDLALPSSSNAQLPPTTLTMSSFKLFVSAVAASLLFSAAWGFQVSYARAGISNPIASTATAESAEGTPATENRRRVSLLVCPAQFCVPDDYTILFDNLREAGIPGDDNFEIGTTVVAPLPRTEWIKVAKQLPTQNFIDATLPVHKTLDWYFEAIETGLLEILAKEGPDANVCIIGHSIGGWVARAFLGGLSR